MKQATFSITSSKYVASPQIINDGTFFLNVVCYHLIHELLDSLLQRWIGEWRVLAMASDCCQAHSSREELWIDSKYERVILFLQRCKYKGYWE